MKGKTRKQELSDFFTGHDLFMPPSILAREAIHYYVRNGGVYKLGGATSEERVAALRNATEEFQGKLVMHKNLTGSYVLFRVRYVLPKTTRDIDHQLYARAAAKEEVQKAPLHHFKVCVEGSTVRKPHAISLDMLVVVTLIVAPPLPSYWSVKEWR